MKQPFYSYRTGETYALEDRRVAGDKTIAIGVRRDYIHRLVDLLNADAERRSPSVHEMLRAFE